VSDNAVLFQIYAMMLIGFSIVVTVYWSQNEKRPPWWLLTLWAVFAVPVLFKAWIAVVLS
jgi:hypothetical protein